MGLMIAFAVVAALSVGIGIGIAIKPRRGPDPRVRALLDDYASAVTLALVETSNFHEPNVFNEQTRNTFQGLKARYVKELIK